MVIITFLNGCWLACILVIILAQLNEAWFKCILLLQTIAAVCHFNSVQEAVDTVVQILQCGIPMAKLGMLMF